MRFWLTRERRNDILYFHAKCDSCGNWTSYAELVRHDDGTVMMLCRPCRDEWDILHKTKEETPVEEPGKMEIDPNKMYTSSEVCTITGHTRVAVCNCCRKGYLPGAVKHGKQWVIPGSGVLTYLSNADPVTGQLPHGFPEAKAMPAVYQWPVNLVQAAFGRGEDDLTGAEDICTVECAMKLAGLTDREIDVLHRRYYLLQTLDECGRNYNLTRERIRMIEAKALRKLRGKPRSRKMLEVGIRKYMEDVAAKEIEKLQGRATELRNEIAILEANKADLEDDTAIVTTADDCQNHILETPIIDLDLPVRPYNCLVRHGCETVGDIVNMPIDEVLKIRNLGRRSILDVGKSLSRIGVRWEAYEQYRNDIAREVK